MEITKEIVVQILCVSAGVVTGYILANILWHHIEELLNKHWGIEKIPKFDIGDKLYVVDCYAERDEFGCIVNEEYFIKTKPLIVSKILIDDYFIFYGEKDTQIGEFIEESHCFLTKEEAEQECRRRNGNM